jgi:hypothetical protein
MTAPLRASCPACNQLLNTEALTPGQVALCPRCQGKFRVPALLSHHKAVLYLHHTRDTDGEVIFYFREGNVDGEPLRSSPILAIKKVVSGGSIASGRSLAPFHIVTRNSVYEVVLGHDTAEHLAREIAVSSKSP